MAINVDEAGLDAFLAAPEGAPAAPVAPATPVAPVTPVADPAAEQVEIPSPVADPALEGQWDEKTTKYIKDLRNEAQNYRNRAKQYNDVFEGYEPEAVEEWLSLASTLKDDPKAAADRFGELADAIRNQYNDPNGAAADAAVADAGLAPAEAANDADRPLTRAELDKIFADRDAQQDLDRRVAKIESDAVELGYARGSDDYDELLYIASRIPSGNIQEAHQKLAAKKQVVIDAYIASLNGASAPKVPGNGAPQTGETGYKTFEEANTALDAWLANQF